MQKMVPDSQELVDVVSANGNQVLADGSQGI
jgi:hypothetical protein